MKLSIKSVLNSIELTWCELRYGIENQFVDDYCAVEMAIKNLGEDDNSELILELASLNSNNDIAVVLDDLCKSESPALDISLANKKWLFITLNYLYYSRSDFEDPLGVVEEVYSDFDYPEEIESFVRYMPMIGEDLGSIEANTARLYKYWKEYLDSASIAFIEKEEQSIEKKVS